MRHINIHVLKPVFPSCPNRDDVGEAKSAVYGGIDRNRISSQCMKRAHRENLYNNFNKQTYGAVRTRFIYQEIYDRLIALGEKEKIARALAFQLADFLGKIDDKKEGRVKTVLYSSPKEYDIFAETLFNLSKEEKSEILADQELIDDKSKKDDDDDADENKKRAKKSQKIIKKSLKKSLKEYSFPSDGVMIILFGRMIANHPSLQIDGCVSYSHWITTHESKSEPDFWSALDDKQIDGEQGAAALGTQSFYSGVMYGYITINLDAFEKALASFTIEQRKQIIKEFVSTIILSTPSAKRNSMNTDMLPAYVFITVVEGQPLNLGAAFDEPVRSMNGLIKPSVSRLKEHWIKIKKSVDTNVTKCELEFGTESSAETTLSKLVEEVAEYVK